MNVEEVLGWIDPLGDYKLTAPTCSLDDFLCWESEEVNTVHLHMSPQSTKLIVFVDGVIDSVVISDDTMYVLSKCRDAVAAQQYKGVWYV